LELAQKDENFKIIYDKLILGNKKFVDGKNGLFDNSLQPNNSILNHNQQLNSSDNITKFIVDKCNNNIVYNNDSVSISNSTKLNKININNSISNSNFGNSNKNQKFFIFTCIDCEIEPCSIFGLSKEEVFVYKNMGNMIIPKDGNFLCALENAVENLNIRNFIIIGHTCCRALKEAIYPTKQGQSNKWLKSIRSIAEANRKFLYEEKRDNENYDYNFSQINIREQMKRFSDLDLIKKIYSKGEKFYIYGFQVINSIGKVNTIDVIGSN